MKRFILTNRQNTIFYGVIMVLGSPIVINTIWKREAIIYNESDIPMARKALIKAGFYSFRRVPVQEDQLISLMDLTP